jgi:predicted nucleic acid-binding protein
LSIIFDASSFINLAHADMLEKVLQLPGEVFCMGPVVEDECAEYSGKISALITQNLLQLIDNNLPATAFFQFMETYALGAGETECLMLCSQTPYNMCSDDAKARRTGINLYGSMRVTGTIGLMRKSTQAGLLKADEAFAAYKIMVARGAFLPQLAGNYFEL